jgi:hypothetical protein
MGLSPSQFFSSQEKAWDDDDNEFTFKVTKHIQKIT